MTSLALEKVGFVYPDGTRALDGVDLAIAPGELVAVIGQNGSGKSTMVRHLDGLLRPTEGRVLHDGADVVDERGRDARGPGRDRLPEPGPPDLRGQGPRGGRIRPEDPRTHTGRRSDRRGCRPRGRGL